MTPPVTAERTLVSSEHEAATREPDLSDPVFAAEYLSERWAQVNSPAGRAFAERRLRPSAGSKRAAAAIRRRLESGGTTLVDLPSI